MPQPPTPRRPSPAADRDHPDSDSPERGSSRGDDFRVLIGPEGFVVSVTPATARLLDTRREDLEGQHYSELLRRLALPDGGPLPAAVSPFEWAASAAPGGELLATRADGTLLQARARRTGQDVGAPDLALTLDPVATPPAARRQIARLTRENQRLRSDLREQARRLEAVAQMGSVLNREQNRGEVLRQIADYGQIVFGTRSALVLAAEEGEFEVVARAGWAPPGGTQLSTDLAYELGMERAVPRVIRDLSAVSAARLFDSLQEAGLDQVVSIPLLTDQNLHGLLLLADEGVVPWGTDELAAFRLFAVQAAAALDNVGRLERQRDIATRLQQALLMIPDRDERVRTDHVYRAASEQTMVGGDFYDLFVLPGGRMGAVIGDVSGKGLEAAVLTVVVRHTIRAYAQENEDPADVLRKTNALIHEAYPASFFVTAFYCTLDPATGELRYSTGGHPPPAVKRENGEVRFLTPNGFVLGVLEEARFGEDRARLTAGDTLVLYTDGVTEACLNTGEMLGEAGLVRLLEGNISGAGTLAHGLLASLEAEVHGRFRDDLAILTVGL